MPPVWSLAAFMKKTVCFVIAALISVFLPPVTSIFLKGMYSFISGGIAAGTAAWMICRLRRGKGLSLPFSVIILAALSLISFGLGFLFTGSLRDASADSLYCLPAAVIIIMMTSQKNEKSHTASRTSVIIGAASAAAVGFLIYMTTVIAVDGGGFSPEVYLEWIDNESARMREIMSSLTVVREGRITALYDAENLDFVTAYTFMMLPGVMIICFFISSWLASVSYYILSRVSGESGTEFPSGWKLTASMVSCAVFISAYIGSLFFGWDNSVYTVCGNLVLILTPLFTILGISGVVERFADEDRRGTAILMTIVALSCLLLSPVSFFTLMSFAGVFYTVFPKIRDFFEKMKSA